MTKKKNGKGIDGESLVRAITNAVANAIKDVKTGNHYHLDLSGLISEPRTLKGDVLKRLEENEVKND
jgi:hypothetical protein